MLPNTNINKAKLITPQEMTAIAAQCRPYSEEEKIHMHKSFHENKLTERKQEIPAQMQELENALAVIKDKVEILKDKLSPVMRQEPDSPMCDKDKICLSTSMGMDIHRLNVRSNEISDVLSSIIRMIEL